MNEYTITITDAHSHSINHAKVPARSKLEALMNVLQHRLSTDAFTTGDTWTITITQP